MNIKSIIPVILCLSVLSMITVFKANTSDISKTKTIKIKCEEMTCAGCKKKITKSINNLEGVNDIDVDLDTKVITVSFDESKTSPDKIIDAIAKAGYESQLIE